MKYYKNIYTNGYPISMLFFLMTSSLGAHYPDITALCNKAYECIRIEKFQEALSYYKEVAQVMPDSAQCCFNIGVCFQKIGQLENACEQFSKALACNPHYTKAYIYKAEILTLMGKKSDALELLYQAIFLLPESYELHMHIGKLYKEEEKFSDAIRHQRIALQLNPSNSTIMIELANSLSMFQDTCAECVDLYTSALQIDPNLIGVLYNLAYTLKKMGKFDEAIALYTAVLEKQPDYALAQYGRGAAYLALGDFEHGWQGYEWRWHLYGHQQKNFSKPLWDGSSLKGKRILVYAEQGLGDSLQFIRYLKILKQRGAYTIFVAQKPLKKLFERCPYIDKILLNGDPNPGFDVYCSLMSLPMLCQTRIDTIPCDIPYLDPEPSLVDYWSSKLSNDATIKVGLCWQGNANYSTAFLRQTVAAKSMSLATFAPLGNISGVSFYSLQKIFGEEQLHYVDTGFIVHTFGDDFDESNGRFMDTAAVMKNLDIVISVDTAICHLAGALGVPVWVPLPLPADWRWMINRDDTPWYPTMTLFRQKTPGDWGPVIESITYALQEYVAHRQVKN